jgi:hypothetical protein
MSVDHTLEHTISESCPIRCLGLAQATEDALVVHWRGDGIYAPKVRDLLQLCESRPLTSVYNIGYGREGEINRRLKALKLGVTA